MIGAAGAEVSLSGLNLIMDLLWRIFPLFLACVEGQRPKEVRVQPGRSVVLNCSVTDAEIFWYIEIHGQLRARIIRTFTGGDNQYYIFPEDKYKAIVGNRLEVRNITAEDYRLYFCTRTQLGQTKIHFEDAFRLVSDVSVAPSNSSLDVTQQQQLLWGLGQSQAVLLSSLGLNVLLTVVTGLVVTCSCVKTRRMKNHSPPPSSQTPETPEVPQYEEIQLHSDPPPRPECVYYKAQLPRSVLPAH